MIDKRDARRRLEMFFSFKRINAWLAQYGECHTWADTEYFEEFIRFANQ